MIYITSKKDRCVTLAEYMIETHSTVRSVANHFGISKSTVHKDVTKILEMINKDMYLEVKSILDTNKKERHIRGGEATKNKYLKSNTTVTTR